MTSTELYWTLSLLTAGWIFGEMAQQARWMGSWRGVWELMRHVSLLRGDDPGQLAFPTERSAMLALAALAGIVGLSWPSTLAQMLRSRRGQ